MNLFRKQFRSFSNRRFDVFSDERFMNFQPRFASAFGVTPSWNLQLQFFDFQQIIFPLDGNFKAFRLTLRKRPIQPVSDELLEASRNTAMQASLKATLACAEAFATTDFRPDLKSFTVPTLIIHGTADKTVPIDAVGRAAAQGISNSKLIEYDGASHGLFATHKEQLTDDLLEFLHQK